MHKPSQQIEPASTSPNQSPDKPKPPQQIGESLLIPSTSSAPLHQNGPIISPPNTSDPLTPSNPPKRQFTCHKQPPT